MPDIYNKLIGKNVTNGERNEALSSHEIIQVKGLIFYKHDLKNTWLLIRM